MEWDALTQVGDESVTHYEVEVSTDNGANWTQLATDITGTTHTHSGLTAGMTRHYRVHRPYCEYRKQPVGDGCGHHQHGAGEHGADGIAATAAERDGDSVGVDALTQVGDESVTHYEVEVSTDNGANWTQLATDITGTTHTHSG